VHEPTAVSVPQLGRFSEAGVAQLDRVDFAFQRFFPVFKEFHESGKTRCNIRKLPYIGLQYVRMIGQVIDYFRRCQAIVQDTMATKSFSHVNSLSAKVFKFSCWFAQKSTKIIVIQRLSSTRSRVLKIWPKHLKLFSELGLDPLTERDIC
jgi:hypothetical protein